MSDALDPRVWMPRVLFVLQTWAHSYADAPNAVLRQKYFHLVTNLPVTLPCPEWQGWFCRLLEDLPVQAFLRDRDAFSDWVWRVRCRVDQRLGGPPPSFARHQDDFYRVFRPGPVRDEEVGSWRRLYLAGAGALALWAFAALA